MPTPAGLRNDANKERRVSSPGPALAKGERQRDVDLAQCKV